MFTLCIPKNFSDNSFKVLQIGIIIHHIGTVLQETKRGAVQVVAREVAQIGKTMEQALIIIQEKCSKGFKIFPIRKTYMKYIYLNICGCVCASVCNVMVYTTQKT